MSKEGCPKSKGCFSFPESCTSSRDCNYLVTYVPDKDGVTFNLSAKFGYVALGFNKDPGMVSSAYHKLNVIYRLS